MTATHPFSKFGPGPYSFVSLETTEDREALNCHRQAMGLTYTTNLCGGTCDLCGTAIWNVFTFETSDGRRFRVGCDCAEKAGEGQAAKVGRRAHDRELAERRAYLTKLERETIERERNAADPEIAEALTDAEVAYWRRTIQELEGDLLRVSSRHIGTVGERMKAIEVVFEGVHGFETIYGTKRIYRMRTRDGHALVWWTTGGLGRRVDEGDVLTITATIKKHGDYRDEQQTELARVKLLERKQTILGAAA